MASFLSRSIYEERHKRIRADLDARGLEALFVMIPDNITYVSGFFLDVATFERPVAAIIPKQGEPCLVLNELSTNHVAEAQKLGAVCIDNVHIYAEHPRQQNRLYTIVEWSSLVVNVLRELGIERGRLGSDSMTLRRLLGRQAEGFDIVSRAELLQEMRLIKSAEELDILRAAGRLSDIGQGYYREAIAEGRSMAEVNGQAALRFGQLLAEEFPDDHTWYMVMSTGAGPGSAAPHGPVADNGYRLKRGDSLISGVLCRINGYSMENERTYILGKPSDEQQRYFSVMLEAQQAAIDACVEGNRVSDIDAAAQTVIERAGLGDAIMHRTGHGIGLSGHEYPIDTAFNHRPLRAGMVMSTEPGIYIKGLGGFRHSDVTIVGKDRPEPITTYPRDLESLTLKGAPPQVPRTHCQVDNPGCDDRHFTHAQPCAGIEPQ